MRRDIRAPSSGREPFPDIKSSSTWQRVLGTKALIPDGACLRYSLLGVVVDVDDAEALAEAEVPLEVVHQRPDKISLYRRAVSDCVVDSLEMGVKIGDAPRIVHRTIDDLVMESGAVLGDVNRRRRIVPVYSHQ